MALAVVLLAGAGLFVRTLENLRETPLGINVRDVMSVSLEPAAGLPADTADVVHAQQLADDLLTIPGVEAAGFVNHGLMLGVAGQLVQRVALTSTPPDAGDPTAMVELISPGFLQTIGLPLVSGRDFTWQDDARSSPVALVTATESARLFPDGVALGRHIRIGTSRAQDVTVVGVVADSRLEDLHVEHPATVFLSLGQRPGNLRWAFLQVRLRDTNSNDVLDRLRAHVKAMGHQTVRRITSVNASVDVALVRERMAARLGALFAGLSLGLIALGLYGLLSQWVTSHTRELGIRLALGAAPSRLRRWIVLQSVALALCGLGIGVPAALATARLANASGWLFGLTAHDPTVFVGAAFVVLSVAIVAALGPAWRVFSLDPQTALRAD